ncbi:MAG: hypothetical protein IJW82_01145 [Clostridia bacterium]|nr:hypothetical protein [Clostridia bacterium]
MNINTQKYIEEYLKIKTKDSQIVNFKLNKPQQKLYDLLKRQAKEGKPQRVVILKARQMGFSTLTEAILFKRTATKANVNSGIIAHKDDATTNLFNMSKLFLNELPQCLKPQTKASNAKEIIFDNKQNSGLGSKIKCMTAGGEGVGRSDTFQNLHLSEVAFWPHTKEILDGLFQSVPNKKNTLIIIESTANGYDYFKELWDKACGGENDFEPLFCAWWELDEYRLPANNIVLTEEEMELKSLYNLDNEQIAWRRWCIRNNCGGDISIFKQEYPSCPEEAFLSSGECIFDTKKIINQIEKSRKIKPVKKGVFDYKLTIKPIYNDNNEIVAVEKVISDINFEEKENGIITIHEDPKVKIDRNITYKRQYSIGGDTSGLGNDYYTAKVVGNDNLQTVATLQVQRINEDKYAEQVYCLGKYYHDALIGIETNYSFVPTRELLNLNYPKLYQRERLDSTYKEVQKVFGFETTRLTKPIIIQNLIKDMRENSENECDLFTLKEMLTFVRKENGKQEAQQGYHDDLVMAKAIANFIATQQGDPNWLKIQEKKVFNNPIEKFFNDYENDEEESYIEW